MILEAEAKMGALKPCLACGGGVGVTSVTSNALSERAFLFQILSLVKMQWCLFPFHVIISLGLQGFSFPRCSN